MMRFLSFASPAALLFLVAPFLIAQNQASPNQPVAQAPITSPEQTGTVFSSDEKLQFFSLEHRSPEQLIPPDSDLVMNRKRDVLAEAEFYGYDLGAGGWSYEQSVCPLIPDYVMLHYSSKDAAGGNSVFTVLVPRNGGRIRMVPVLSHGATRFKPAPSDPRNFELFGQVVPADAASKNSGPDGRWLLLSVCYAEMTGARPQVPNRPGLDVHMIKAPPPTLRISAGGTEHEVRFVDPISQSDYRLWDISYNDAGRVIGVSDDQHSFGEPVVRPISEPAPKELRQLPAAPIKEIPASQQTTPYPVPAAKPAQPQ